MAVDGTHIPYVPHVENTKNDYKNYKGWTSILAVAFVNSYYMLADAIVGYAGRSGDNTVIRDSSMMRQLRRNRLRWMGADGLVLADGGASDGGQLLLNPIHNAVDVADVWYNFCHSSTRFYVEETFGRWKNRFRFLLYACDLDHKRMSNLIYASCIMHNVCTRHKDTLDVATGADGEWLEYFRRYARHACPSCTRRNVMHCTHTASNRAVRSIVIQDSDARDVKERVRDMLWQKLHDSGLSARDAVNETDAHPDD